MVIEFDSVNDAISADENPSHRTALQALSDGAERDVRMIAAIPDRSPVPAWLRDEPRASCDKIRVVEPPVWFTVVAWTEIVFVITLLVVETARYGQGPRITAIERALHPISDDRYFRYFFIPAAALLSAFALFVGGSIMLDQDGSPLSRWAGQLLAVVSMVVFLVYCGRHAARLYPRPVGRARVRRALAEAEESLSSGAPLSDREAARLLSQLTRIGRVGDRLIARAASLAWRDAIRKDTRWLIGPAVIAMCLPLAGLVWISLRTASEAENRDATSTVVVLFAAIAAVVVAMFLRLLRTRRELNDLGLELSTYSRRLVDQLGSVVESTQERTQGMAPEQEAHVTRTVFVIYGRDDEVKGRMFDFLRALGLVPQQWEHLMDAAGSPLAHINEAVATGLTVGRAQAVVTLFTPDDVVLLHPRLHDGQDRDDRTRPLFQPRPNVLLELGRAMAVYPKQTIIVEFGPDLRPISDLAGLSVVRFDGSDVAQSMTKLVSRLRQAGCPVDEHGTDWIDPSRFADLDAYTRRPMLPDY